MKIVTRVAVLTATFLFVVAGRPGANAGVDAVARGRYLVTAAGQCSDCHGSGLRGGPLDFLRPGLPGVAYTAPAIAGLPKLSRAQATYFLQTGSLPSGKRARPPMPAYEFSASDASAIVAYLKSLR